MNNKLKSLIYLSCFLLAAVLYQATENSTIENTIPQEEQIVEADITITPYAAAEEDIKTN